MRHIDLFSGIGGFSLAVDTIWYEEKNEHIFVEWDDFCTEVLKWPPMLEAIALFKPRWVIAENVAGLVTWNDGMVLETVCADLENEGYEVQPFIIPACAVQAPHRRDRVWIVANRPDNRGGRGNDKKRRAKKRKLVENKQRWNPARDKSEGRNREWDRDWREVALATCNVRVDDGFPRRLDRNPRLKALGNAIVPQVAIEIMKAIKYADR